jgi:hypothetical protein
VLFIIGHHAGDGNANGGFNNFFEVVVNALELHWRVELWAWRHSCSKRFKDLVTMFPDRFSIMYLNDIEDVILFSAKVVKSALPSTRTASTVESQDKMSEDISLGVVMPEEDTKADVGVNLTEDMIFPTLKDNEEDEDDEEDAADDDEQ